MTPALPSGALHVASLPAPAVTEVSLTGLSLSLTDVVGLLDNFGIGGQLGNLDLGGLLGNLDLGGLLGNLDLGELLGNLDLGNLAGGLTPGLARAVLVEFVKEASPVVKATAGDVFQYVTSSVGGLVVGPDSIPVRFGAAIAEIPAVVKAAFGDLKNLDFLAALQTLNQGLLAPVMSIGEVLLETANGIRTYVGTQVATLAGALPGILMSAIAAVIGNNGQGLLDTIKNLVGGLLPGAATPAAALVAAPKAAAAVAIDAPAVSEAAPAIDVEAPAAKASRAPRAAASGRALPAPAAAAESVAEPEAQAAESVADEAPAPAARPRVGAVRAAIADAVSNGPAVANRPKHTQRAERHSTERPAAAAARSAR